MVIISNICLLVILLASFIFIYINQQRTMFSNPTWLHTFTVFVSPVLFFLLNTLLSFLTGNIRILQFSFLLLLVPLIDLSYRHIKEVLYRKKYNEYYCDLLPQLNKLLSEFNLELDSEDIRLIYYKELNDTYLDIKINSDEFIGNTFDIEKELEKNIKLDEDIRTRVFIEKKNLTLKLC